eukprot:6036916-Pyramimonas_sp.AAC.1
MHRRPRPETGRTRGAGPACRPAHQAGRSATALAAGMGHCLAKQELVSFPILKSAFRIHLRLLTCSILRSGVPRHPLS